MTQTFLQLFIDTNVFIQLRDLTTLPWHEEFPEATGIDLLVSQTVIRELDHFKTSTRDRQRDRARRALKSINAAAKPPDFSIELKQKPITLRLVIAQGPIPDWSTLPGLDPNSPDDRLVAEVKSFGGAALLSHDATPRIRAQLMGIEVFEPPEEWLLPPEQTDSQRKIAQLERALERATNQFPRITASFGPLESPKESFAFVVPFLQPLEAETQKKLVAAYLERHPHKRLPEDPPKPGVTYFYSLGEDTPASFNRKLDEFERDVAAYFAKLHKTMFHAMRAAPIDYVIKNDSGVAAEGLRIEVDVDGSATLFANGEEADSFFGPLGPPKLPVRARGGPFDYLASVNAINRPRDPTGFYPYARPEYGDTHSAWQCEDFRAARVWEDDIWIGPMGQLPMTCTVTLEVSASNLPTPIRKSVAVSMEIKKLDWSDPIVKPMLPEAIRDFFDAAR
jgi:hypothetical protein